MQNTAYRIQKLKERIIGKDNVVGLVFMPNDTHYIFLI